MKRFRMALTVAVLVAGVGLLAWKESVGLAFLPLLGMALRYWFGGKHGRSEGGRPDAGADSSDAAVAEGGATG